MGFYISSGCLAFFYKYLRPIIEAGRLYKVYSPLYQLDDKEDPFVANKAEMVERYHSKIVKTYKVTLFGQSKAFSKEDLRDFLTDSYEYRESLIRAAETSGRVNKFLLEDIIAQLVLMGFVKWIPDSYDKLSGHFEMKDVKEEFGKQKFITTLMSQIQKKYPEIEANDRGCFYGVVEGKYCEIRVSPRLFKKAEDLLPIISEYGYMLTAENKKSGATADYSIGEFLDQCQGLMSKIITRFKGLGELNAKDLRKTTMDINNRISVQFTVEDVERELEIFYMTHGNSPEDLIRRKKMMKDYRIRREDLDN